MDGSIVEVLIADAPSVPEIVSASMADVVYAGLLYVTPSSNVVMMVSFGDTVEFTSDA